MRPLLKFVFVFVGIFPCSLHAQSAPSVHRVRVHITPQAAIAPVASGGGSIVAAIGADLETSAAWRATLLGRRWWDVSECAGMPCSGFQSGWSAEAGLIYRAAAVTSLWQPYAGVAVGLYRWSLSEFDQRPNDLSPLGSARVGVDLQSASAFGLRAELRAYALGDDQPPRAGEPFRFFEPSVGVRFSH